MTIESVYLAGAMRNRKGYGFHEFLKAAGELRGKGYIVVSPAEHDMEEHPEIDFLNSDGSGDDLPEGFMESAMLWDFKAIMDTDAVVVLPGWESSKGVEAEMAVARSVGRPIYSYPEWRLITPQNPYVIAQRDRYSAGNARVDHVIPTNGYQGPQGSQEVRVVDPVTGGAKGSKPCQVGALDSLALEELGLVAGFGGKKYARYNFLKGYAWSLSVDAAFRHFLAFLSGEDRDPESDLLHTAHACWHLHALTGFQLRSIGTDDRP